MGNPNSSSSSFTLFKRSLLTLALGGVLVGWGTETTAQEDQDEAKTAALEEILVTAERRTASLQEVPAAISAFDSVELERRQAYNVLDAMSNIPNLLVSNNPGQALTIIVLFLHLLCSRSEKVNRCQ